MMRVCMKMDCPQTLSGFCYRCDQQTFTSGNTGPSPEMARDAAMLAMYEALECALHELNFAYNGNEYFAVLTKGRVRNALAQAKACGIGG